MYQSGIYDMINNQYNLIDDENNFNNVNDEDFGNEFIKYFWRLLCRY